MIVSAVPPPPFFPGSLCQQLLLSHPLSIVHVSCGKSITFHLPFGDFDPVDLKKNHLCLVNKNTRLSKCRRTLPLRVARICCLGIGAFSPS